jgi:outer membrane lipoprotein-sorting protein
MKRMLIGLLVLMIGAAAHGDAKAEAAWAHLTEKLKAAKSLTGVYETRYGATKQRSTFAFLRPGSYKLESANFGMYCDGKTVWRWYPQPKQYQSTKAEGTFSASWLPAFEGLGELITPYKLGDLEERMFEGRKCLAIPRSTPERRGSDHVIIYIDAVTGLPAGIERGTGEQTVTMVYTDVRLNPELRASDFAWKPPKNATPYKAPDYSAKLLKVGAKAPEFALKDPSGEEWDLSKQLAEHKATLVNFWFYG